MALDCRIGGPLAAGTGRSSQRKLWQLSGFRSRAVGSHLGENGALALGKAPFSATFGPILDDILRVFSASFLEMAHMGPNATPKGHFSLLTTASQRNRGETIGFSTPCI
jgi:hypothetical protein